MGKTILVSDVETSNLNTALGIESVKNSNLCGPNNKLGELCHSFFTTPGDKNLMDLFKSAAELCENDNELAFAFFCVGASHERRMSQQKGALGVLSAILGGALSAITEDEDNGPTYEHVVTEADIANNPELAEQGVKVGETINVPEGETLRDTPPSDEATAEYVPAPNEPGQHNPDGDETKAGPGHA